MIYTSEKEVELPVIVDDVECVTECWTYYKMAMIFLAVSRFISLN